VLGGDLDLASGNPEQRPAVDDEPGHAADATALTNDVSCVKDGLSRVVLWPGSPPGWSDHVGRFFDFGSGLVCDRADRCREDAVLHEADTLLVEAGASHATVELEEIARCWPGAMKSSRSGLVYGNLAALWSNFAAIGASRLLLAGLIEQRSELRLVSKAVPGAALTLVRLHAPLPVLEKRIRLREPASPEGEIDGARWWTRHLDQVRLEEDYLVETDDRAVGEVARDVLRLAGWLP
jgi:hypothetical protein